MENWRKYANTVMVSIIMLFVSIGGPIMVSEFRDFSEKLDSLLITVTVHNSESEIWKQQIVKNTDAIEKLQDGQHEATADRFTKEEAMQAIEALKIWVDKYYERKH